MEAPLDIIPKDCKLCSLWKHRKNVVWGNGNMYAPLLLLGEGPGSKEDKQGLAFVGKSGNLITKVLWMFKIPRNYVLFLNVVSCRPLNNKNPTLKQILAHRPFLMKQVQMCPYIKVILALGGVSWFGLTGIEEPVSQNHGVPKKVGKYIYMKTFHPAYILRKHNPEIKKTFIRDIRKALQISGLIKKRK